MMARWMCGVSLKDRKRSVDLYMQSSGCQSVADVVRRGRLRWFGHLERRSVDDWVSVCRKVYRLPFAIHPVRAAHGWQ